MRLEFADDLKSAFESQTQLEIPTDWVTEAEVLESNLERGYGNSYDFDQDPCDQSNLKVECKSTS